MIDKKHKVQHPSWIFPAPHLSNLFFQSGAKYFPTFTCHLHWLIQYKTHLNLSQELCKGPPWWITMTMTLHITHADGYLNDCHVVLLVCKYLMLFCHETTDDIIQSDIPRCYPRLVSDWSVVRMLASDWLTASGLNWEYELDVTMTLYLRPRTHVCVECISKIYKI